MSFVISFILCSFLLQANELSTHELKAVAEKELEYTQPTTKKSQTVKIKTPQLKATHVKPGSEWSVGYQVLQINPVAFQIKSVKLQTPKVNQSQNFYLRSQTPIFRLLNDQYLNLFGSFSYGRTKTEFTSVSKYQDGWVELYQPTVGLSFSFYKYKDLNLYFETGYAVYLFNIKNTDSNFQQSESSQSLQNTITAYWKLFNTSGVEFSLSNESLLSGSFEPTNGLRLGFRGEF